MIRFFIFYICFLIHYLLKVFRYSHEPRKFCYICSMLNQKLIYYG
nr:MAG TPA: hypothetical protein [Caudoviricetes sp.]